MGHKIIIRWILRSYRKNSAVVVYMTTWFLRKFSGTWPYRAIVLRIPNFFRLHLEVASELVSGIKMFLISMVALKILIPQKILQRPYGYTGHRGIR